MMKPNRIISDPIEMEKVMLAILVVLLFIDIIIGVFVLFDVLI